MSYLTKSLENLTVAQWAYDNGHYNASANRAYYAVFQAALAALANVSVITVEERVSHERVQALFARELINRRKLYPSDLKSHLLDLHKVRETADYKMAKVSAKESSRQLKKAKEFVQAVSSKLTTSL
jgi:uncharacterized protein (UPF0332 family)